MIDEEVSADCLDFEERLNDRLDNRLPLVDDLQLASHARNCEACGRLLSDYQKMLTRLMPSRSTLSEAESQTSRNLDVGVSRGEFDGSSFPMSRSRLKLLLSLTPSFAALLIVSISMMIDSRSMDVKFGLHEENWNRGVKAVAVRGEEAGIEAAVPPSQIASGDTDQAYDMYAETLTLPGGVVGGARRYSSAFYQLANDHSPIQTCRLMQHEIVSQVAMPHEPLYRRVPYRGEFSTIPQFRFFIGFAVQLIQQAFPNTMPSIAPDLGIFGEAWGRYNRLT